ncbi:hypothetical protein OROGR_027978 [Orobanche gracilis]
METPAETDTVDLVELAEEIDGDQIGSRNYRFSKIGESIPMNLEFDPQCLPSQPLAVSERLRLLFVAYPQGFCVARTKDVIATAEEIKEKQKGPSIQELSLVDVPIGKVSILALSADESLLAACVASHVHFFAASALLHKDKEPSYSVSVEDSNYIKDVRWAKKVAKAYLILSANGKLYHGTSQGPLVYVMDAVDSVDWSGKGNFLAVAQKNTVSILSSELKEKLKISLPFQSVIGDSDVNQFIRVDSIRWIRPDCIAVGCFQLNDDGEEENYVVQVITSRDGSLTDAASKPTVLSFSNVFMDFCPDAVPTKNGPHLFLSYLDLYGLAFVANRNLSRNVAVFCWLPDSGKNEAAMVDILNDAWTLHIDSQENGEENVILGLSVDKVSQNKDVRFIVGDEETEVSPCCVIICLTIDGNISVFHFASASGALLSPESCASENDDASQTTTENMGPKPLVYRRIMKADEPEKALSLVLNQDSNAGNQFLREVKHSTGLSSRKVVSDSSPQSVAKDQLLGSNEPLCKAPPTSSPSLWSTRSARVDASKTLDGRFTSLPSDVDNSNKHALQSAGHVLEDNTDINEKAKPNVAFTSFGQAASTAQVGEMANKLDILLEGIEGKGGFLDASITSQTKSVMELEDGIWTLSSRCKTWEGIMKEQLRELQLLLDKTVQVSVRKEYIEGVFKQATDSRYLILWNRQKLSSELEMRQRRIEELNQELTNKLIELERHFNALEFNKFGENGGMQRSRRVMQKGHSRQTQSLHSLYNTMQAQLAAAEQLSGCLSNQMAALSIKSSAKQEAKKKLFESIGLSYIGDDEKSPARNRTSSTPLNKEHLITSSSLASKEHSTRNQASFAKSPETARRRRESLDRSWASFEPPKTTVKRVLKEDYDPDNANRSLLNIDKQYLSPQSQNKVEVAHSAHSSMFQASLNSYKSKGIAGTSERQTESLSTSFHQRTAGSLDNGSQMLSTKSYFAFSPPSILETRTAHNDEQPAFKLSDGKSKNSLSATGKIDSITAGECNFAYKQIHTESLDHFKLGFTKSTNEDQKNNTRTVAETPSSDSKFPVYPQSSEKPNQPNNNLTASIPSQSLFSSLPSSKNLPSFAPSVSEPSSSTSFTVAKQETTSQPRTSVPSTLDFPSTPPLLKISESNLSSISPSSTVIEPDSLTSSSNSPLAMVGSRTERKASVDDTQPETEKDVKTQDSASQLSVSTSDFKLGPLTSSGQTELSTGSQLGSQIDSGDCLSKSFSVIKTEQLPSAIALSSEGSEGNAKNAVLDSSDEEGMDEEAPETDQTTELALGSLGGFGFGSTQNSTSQKPNPFGVANLNQNTAFTSLPNMMMPASSGELFRPASFNFQPPQPLQPATVNFSGGFNSGQVSAVSGFGQPSNIGAGQQALGSVLGSFGQSRQLGTGLPGNNITPASGFGSGFRGISPGGFGGGFASAATAGGFASLAAGGGGGFAAAASGGGGFAAAATGGGGFAAAPTGGGGFAAAGGGFGGGAPTMGGAGSNQAVVDLELLAISRAVAVVSLPLVVAVHPELQDLPQNSSHR